MRINIEDLHMEGSKLFMGFNITSSKNAKEIIINRIKEIQ